ncbi:hypothetical protein H8356DRAFT_1636965 [Neocallimastix lanati (nom. inval.)]|nr:hypothetical protein H8356DRAFT_1636965 [Neocallimastix sp. JGI-2020a]
MPIFMAIVAIFVGICFFIRIIWKFLISDSVNLIFVLIYSFDTYSFNTFCFS